jgi:hypothetical protein
MNLDRRRGEPGKWSTVAKGWIMTDQSNNQAEQEKSPASAPNETARERFMKELSTNPRLKEGPKTGTGYIIGGMKP